MKIAIDDITDEKYGVLCHLITNLDNGTTVDLPHGSGINGDWTIEDKGDRYICYNGYDTMDEIGYYDMWIDFSITIPKKEPMNFKLRFHTDYNGWNRVYKYALRECLDDLFAMTLSELK